MVREIIQSASVIKCKSCGGLMLYSIKDDALVCNSCGTKRKVARNVVGKNAFEHKLESADSAIRMSKVSVIKCKSCGGTAILNGYETTLECEYCGSQHIVNYEEEGIVKPETMIPFTVTREKAADVFKKWMKHKYLAPFGMRKNAKQGNINGVYSPYWDYDMTTVSDYKGKNLDIRKVDKETKLVWQYVMNKVMVKFDDVFINGSDSKNIDLLNEMSSYNFDALEAYNPEYIAGFHSERYARDVHEGITLVRGKLKKEIEEAILKDMGGKKKSIVQYKTSMSNIKFRHSLLPVWVSTYTFARMTYPIYINGQTGEVVGKTPISILKVFLIIVIIAGILAGTYYFAFI